MAVAWRADVDDIDVRPVDDLLPVGGGLVPPEALSRLLDVLRASRPQMTFMRGVSFGVKKRETCRHALLCARPMKAHR